MPVRRSHAVRQRLQKLSALPSLRPRRRVRVDENFRGEEGVLVSPRRGAAAWARRGASLASRRAGARHLAPDTGDRALVTFDPLTRGDLHLRFCAIVQREAESYAAHLVDFVAAPHVIADRVNAVGEQTRQREAERTLALVRDQQGIRGNDA